MILVADGLDEAPREVRSTLLGLSKVYCPPMVIRRVFKSLSSVASQ